MRSKFVVWAALAIPPAVGSALLAPALAASLSLAGSSPPPLPVLMAVAFAQGTVVFGVAAAAALWFAPRVGRRPEVLYAWVERTAMPRGAARTLLMAALLGLLIGAIMAAADGLIFQPQDPLKGPLAPRLIGAMLYGGIGEEVICRLLLASALVLVLSRWAGGMRPAVWIMSIVIAALAFAAGHLPLATALGMDAREDVARIFALNGFAGIAFGVIYWRRGPEAAILAHACAHLPLQLIPLLT